MLKFLGGCFLMIGAVVGGGILAIPIVSVQFGFLTTSLFILLAWVMMTKTGLYVLELSLSCPEKYNSYYSIVGKYLGGRVQKITIVLFLWLLYLSLASYISGCVSVLISHSPVNNSLLSYFNGCIFFVLLFGSLIVMSAKIIVRLNVFIVMLKLVLLFLVIASASQYIPLENISRIHFSQGGTVALLLIIINAFGFQFIVPSLVSYYGKDNCRAFKRMLLTSTSTVMMLYLAWLYTIYSIIPLEGDHGLMSIYQSNNQLLAFNESLQLYLTSPWVKPLLSLFEVVALFGSFFCVSLGVFDFLVDIFKTKKRLMIGLLTFSPPLLLTLFSQNMYVYAMSVSGYIAIVLEIMIPVWAIQKLPTKNRGAKVGFPGIFAGRKV